MSFLLVSQRVTCVDGHTALARDVVLGLLRARGSPCRFLLLECRPTDLAHVPSPEETLRSRGGTGPAKVPVGQRLCPGVDSRRSFLQFWRPEAEVGEPACGSSEERAPCRARPWRTEGHGPSGVSSQQDTEPNPRPRPHHHGLPVLPLPASHGGSGHLGNTIQPMAVPEEGRRQAQVPPSPFSPHRC